MEHIRYKIKTIRFRRFCWTVVALLSLFCLSCQKLDEDGGYFDEKSGIYKYVSPRRDLEKSASSLKIKSPRTVGEQRIQGTVTRVESDLKSVWIRISSRQVYMILAESLAKGNRNDRDKELKLDLKFVSPKSMGPRDGSFRKRWQEYVEKMLERQLLKQPILADIEYKERSARFRATLYRVIETKQGDRLRNINLWMVRRGLSYYFIDGGRSPLDGEFSKAQALARQDKAGIWQYD